MSADSVSAYLERQPRLAWRRRALRALIRLAMRVLSRTTIQGRQHLPTSGSVILMMNHITALDPGVVMGAVTDRLVIPMTKAEAARDWFMGPFVWWYGAFTVNRGEVDRRALRIAIGLLERGELILIAPEGTRSPQGMIAPRPGLSYIAAKTGAVVVPVTVSEAVGWRDKLLRFQRATVTVTFGRPFRFKTDEGRRVPRQALDQMMQEAMFQLAITQPDPALRGVFSDLSQATTDTLDFDL